MLRDICGESQELYIIRMQVSKEEASTWTIINNSRFKRQITIKDNVRDSMFAAVGAIKSDKLTVRVISGQSTDYRERLARGDE